MLMKKPLPCLVVHAVRALFVFQSRLFSRLFDLAHMRLRHHSRSGCVVASSAALATRRAPCIVQLAAPDHSWS